jgi:hypothetical protein
MIIGQAACSSITNGYGVVLESFSLTQTGPPLNLATQTHQRKLVLALGVQDICTMIPATELSLSFANSVIVRWQVF